MKLDPVNLIGGFYQDDNLPWSAQDTVNWIPRPAEAPGTLSPMKLVGAPGLTFLADIDDEPVRIGGIRNVEGKLFVVAGTTLYEVATDYSTTVRGTIPGAGPVSMQHNQQEFGNELSIANGSSIYVWNTWTNTFTQVTDDAATGSVQTAYLNRRLIHMDPFGRFLYPSAVDNALAYNSLDRSDSEASPDKFVGLGVSQFELVGFSQRTIEFYADTGSTPQPFRSKKIAIQRGCASRQSIVQIGGTLAWLGDDGIFYRLNGYQDEAISTGPINKAISADNWANCFGTVWEDRKHEVAYWTFPDGQTWGWDAWTNLWHRRESFGLNRWRINAVEKWNGMWIAGDFQRGRLYAMDWEAYHENGAPLVASRTAPPIYNNGNKIICPLLELVFDTGRGRLPALSISGDVPNGSVGQAASASYTAEGGISPYTFAVISGTFPTGLSLAANGQVTGTYSAQGSFSWVVQATDAAGQTATLEDSCEVVAVAMLAIRETSSGPEVLMSPDGMDWSGAWVPETIGFNYVIEAPDRVISYTPNTAAAYRTLDGGGSFAASTGAGVPSNAVYGSRSPVTGTIIINGNASIRSTDQGVTFAAIGGAPGGGSANAIGSDWYIYDGSFHKSTNDGLTFGASLGPFADVSNSPFFSVWSDGTMIVVGSRRSTTSAPVIVETTDGAAYNYPAMPSGLGATACVTCVTSGGGLWVAGLDDSSIIYRDIDGVWHKAADTFDGVIPRRISYNGSLFVMIGGEAFLGDAGTIKTSPDGNVWTTRRSEALLPNGQVWRLVGCERSDT